MNPSTAYFAALEDSKQIHKGKSFTGKFLRPHAPFIKEIIDRLGCKSILDYGCGKGEQYTWVIPSIGKTLEEWWGVRVVKYDPAYEAFAREPHGAFDLVICTQTLGTIPVEDRAWVIDRLYSLSNKALYISERLDPARKMPTAQWSQGQWQEVIQRFNSPIEVTLATRLTVGGEKITTHTRWLAAKWAPVIWPEGVRPMNHTWA